MAPKEKTKKGLTDTNTEINCKVDIKRRGGHLLGKKMKKTLKTASKESLELTTSVRISSFVFLLFSLLLF